jgi:hypothetical protein
MFKRRRKPEPDRKYWDIQWRGNPWLCLGIDIDHVGPFIQFHLPGVIVKIGRDEAFFPVSLRFGRIYWEQKIRYREVELVYNDDVAPERDGDEQIQIHV